MMIVTDDGSCDDDSDIPVFHVEGQTNTILKFEFSTPSLCVPSSGSMTDCGGCDEDSD